MDLTRLKTGDRREWDDAYPQLFSIAHSRASAVGGLTGSEIEDIASDAIILALKRIGDIKSETHLYGFVAVAARNIAWTLIRNRGSKYSREANTESLEARLENVADSLDLGDFSDPQLEIMESELAAIYPKLCLLLPTEDIEILRERVVLRMKEREIGEKRGWSTSSTHTRIAQACDRLKRLILSKPETVQLIKDLGWNHYLNE